MWLKERSKLDLPEELKDVLFVSKYKDVWKTVTISVLDGCATQFSKFLNVDFYFHCLRHNFCTGLSQANVPASVIQEIIGWSNISMVSLYDDTTIDDKLGKYFDETGIKKVEKKEISDL